MKFGKALKTMLFYTDPLFFSTIIGLSDADSPARPTREQPPKHMPSMPRRALRAGALRWALALLLCWRMALSFTELQGRRAILKAATAGVVGIPSVAWAKRGASLSDNMATKQAMPERIEPEEGLVAEEWQAVDVGESTVVDPDDPKYKNMRLMKDLEKQKARNDEYNSMSTEENSRFASFALLF